MFESTMAGHMHQAHINPSTMHPEAFQASRAFIEWLDTLQGNNTIGTSKSIDDSKN